MQLPLPPQDERKKVVEDVDKDRRHAIDAAIVRTMKSRKVLSHQNVSPPLPLPPVSPKRLWEMLSYCKQGGRAVTKRH